MTTAAATASPTAGMTAAASPRLLLRLAAIIFVTACVGLFTTYRFERAGQWLPEVPARVGEAWTAYDTPLPDETLKILGNPKALGREYRSPFGEVVGVSVIAAGSFDTYHDPTVCNTGSGSVLTAQKVRPIDGPDSPDLRAMVFRRGDARIVLHYWIQNRDATTATEARMGTYRDLRARLQTGLGALIKGNQSCLVRVYTVVPPDDERGAQTRRNLDEVSRAVYHALREGA